MSERIRQDEVIKRTFELLILFLVVIGLSAIILSVVLRGVVDSHWIEVLLGTGLAFFPAGIVAILLSRFAFTRELIIKFVDAKLIDSSFSSKTFTNLTGY